MAIRKNRELSEQLENVVLGKQCGLYSVFSRSDAYGRREWWHNVAFCKVSSAPCRSSHHSIRIRCTAIDLDISFLTFSRRPSPVPQPPNPPPVRMRSSLRRSGRLTGPHPMVRRLFRFVGRPRRSRVRDVWIERFVRSCNGREPQGTAHSIPDVFISLCVDGMSFQIRGVSLPGAEPYPTYDSLPQRFTRHDFTTSKALTLREVRKTLISFEESQR